MKSLIIVIISLVLMSGGCRLPEPVCHKSYAFEFPIGVTPAQPTFHVGDTIWLDANIPNSILDNISRKYINITDFELQFSFNIEEVNTNIPLVGAEGEFDYVEELGNIDIGFYSYISTESTTNKRFRIGLIPTRAAIYAMSINLPSYYIEIESDPGQRLNIQEGDCREYITGGRIIQVNYGRTNHSLVKGKCRTTHDGLAYCYPDELFFRNNGGFAFRVVP